MSLSEIIRNIEEKGWKDDDFEHPLAVQLSEEIEQCKENDLQKRLFDDVKILGDVLIEPYLKLDREDKLRMAEEYQHNKAFDKESNKNINPAAKGKLARELGRKNAKLLSQIYNFTRIQTILENYVEFLEQKDRMMGQKSLANYLRTHTIEGEKAKMASSESLRTFADYDFKNDRRLKLMSNNHVLKSLLFGVNNELADKVKNAQTLLPTRTKILNDYISFVNQNQVTPGRKSLACYLRTHTLEGRETKEASKESLRAFTKYDFKRTAMLELPTNEEILESMLFGIDEQLAKEVRNAQSLLQTRTKILNNYISFLNQKQVTPGCKSLVNYLKSHTFEGEETERETKESLNTFAGYDFKKDSRLESCANESVLESMLFGVDDKLADEVRKAQMLLQARTKILNNYISFLSQNLVTPRKRSLVHYLRTHTLEGKEIETASVESLNAFTQYDFRADRTLKLSTKETVLESMLYGITDKNLIRKVRQYNR